MNVAPGEMVHVDENGAVKFPAQRLAEAPEKVRKLADQEGALQARVATARSAAQVRAA